MQITINKHAAKGKIPRPCGRGKRRPGLHHACMSLLITPCTYHTRLRKFTCLMNMLTGYRVHVKMFWARETSELL